MQISTKLPNSLSTYDYITIFARIADSQNNWQWLYIRRKHHEIYETLGEKPANAETPAKCAERQLSAVGAVDFFLTPAFDYFCETSDKSQKATKAQKSAKSNEFAENPPKTHNGQVFLADIYKITKSPPNSEIAERVILPNIPAKTTEILPLLFDELQKHLQKNTPNEYCDLLDENRQPLNKLYKRGEPQPLGTYIAVVRGWIMNSHGEVLITRRAMTKLDWAGFLEIPSGTVLAGETTLAAAVRELHEETGLKVNAAKGRLFNITKDKTAFVDNWLFVQDFNIADVTLQDGETIDAKTATLSQILALVKTGEFIPFVRNEIMALEKFLQTGEND
ncbi:MAG: NUDIX domain-containing protein [Defluviitaleaceae bacterium]|nr:NUDIX domain-containing protein [Defluviitaleaceae bacterium]